ncbi:MAG: dual specificity protein phosphatase family protein [Campylobacter gracilis]|uniref:dual specificity protein phosphatase family protein n=1 Tax=Campylobacter gracilis TaxID=824 RepID=UPI0026ED3AB2|nr:dual specificity protein phosphatase family protein [Campylobacter gracilis]MBS6152921.1 dual specificity protein phosphatase family protein [Campylobacter gracilis]
MKTKPFLSQLAALVVVAAIFYASYGATNALASARANVPEIYFAWERAVPFWAWSIVPYWSLNLLYALGFFLCRDAGELARYVMQLLVAQMIATLFFIAFPLQMSWGKPAVSGFSGFLFSSLAAFDLPFNQAPSLHIILCVVVGAFYLRKAHAVWLKAALVAWFALIGLSVLTTYQHHFIDIPTGLAAGCLVLLIRPLEGAPLRFAIARESARYKWAALYLGLAFLTLFAAILGAKIWGAWMLWLSWASLSFALVACGYAFLGAGVFAKNEQGRHAAAAKALLFPYLCVARLNALFWLRGRRLSDEILPGLYLGSVKQAGKFDAVLDCAAEFERPGGAQIYASLPMLDMITPCADELKRGADELERLVKRALCGGENLPQIAAKLGSNFSAKAGCAHGRDFKFHRQADSRLNLQTRGSASKDEEQTLTDSNERAVEINGKNVLVCCALGYGRSASVLLAWLVIYAGLGFDEALNLLKSRREKIAVASSLRDRIARLVDGRSACDRFAELG